jgi:predicted tellurium resistance membrane protein TerC
MTLGRTLSLPTTRTLHGARETRPRLDRSGLAAVLAFAGVKMIISELYKTPTPISLAVVLTVLPVAIAVSVAL